jgi:hypothetical protein
VTSLLDYLNWNGWGISPEIWTVIMLLTTTAITWAVALTRGDVAYALVIVWALTGIAVRHASTPLVSTTAWIMSVTVALAIVLAVWRSRQDRLARPSTS